MNNNDAPLRRGGRRATPPGHVKVYKTAIFKIHNPSKRKRAMLIDSMKRAHLAYERLLNRFMPDAAEIERISKLPKPDRRKALKPITAQVVLASRYPHLSNNAKDAIRVDALAQILPRSHRKSRVTAPRAANTRACLEPPLTPQIEGDCTAAGPQPPPGWRASL